MTEKSTTYRSVFESIGKDEVYFMHSTNSNYVNFIDTKEAVEKMLVRWTMQGIEGDVYIINKEFQGAGSGYIFKNANPKKVRFSVDCKARVENKNFGGALICESIEESKASTYQKMMDLYTHYVNDSYADEIVGELIDLAEKSGHPQAKKAIKFFKNYADEKTDLDGLWAGIQLFKDIKESLNKDFNSIDIAHEVLEVLGKDKSDKEKEKLREEIQESLEIKDDTATFEADGIEYKLIEDEDTAIQMAEEDLKNLVDEEGPEMLSPDFAKEYYYVTEVDQRLIAVDEADAYIEGMDEEDIVGEADYGDQYEKAKEAGDAELMARLVSTAKDHILDDYTKNVKEQLKKDPVSYFEDLGYELKDAVKNGLLTFDTDKAVKEAVRLDGWAHFLSHYDGEYEQTKSGMVFFRES